MKYFVVAYNSEDHPIADHGPFENVHDAFAKILQQHYCDPPHMAGNNAYVGLDSLGIAYIYISKATIGVHRMPKHIKKVMIKREDHHVLSPTARRSTVSMN